MKSFEKTMQAVMAWSEERGLNNARPADQMLKLTEEAGELAAAIARGKRDGAVDAIGDVLVVLTILCQQLRLELPDCYEAAYRTIRNRRGKTVNGVFVKDGDLEAEDVKPPVNNTCVVCGAAMPEGDHVCVLCKNNWVRP
jgi:NTP pyrophosphatase (non-canonical NTP hydrolase)